MAGKAVASASLGSCLMPSYKLSGSEMSSWESVESPPCDEQHWCEFNQCRCNRCGRVSMLAIRALAQAEAISEG
jgi:hypothetical protein